MEQCKFCYGKKLVSNLNCNKKERKRTTVKNTGEFLNEIGRKVTQHSPHKTRNVRKILNSPSVLEYSEKTTLPVHAKPNA